ncbi:DUF58 domain-containing protein [Streptomyces echinatus]|uniref:Uncharacterized protein (DUF58 family) n=1 Tax=Streptomyces echinatus TaxID=67293 RepID=A0A7W9PVZ6_9ACTN|nr:DUF58 domain-containing protein [Streptomyces echinatus]MBB5928287.1 uncharacterized protein (DUF58 family) [Streptomyces echinatus]
MLTRSGLVVALAAAILLSTGALLDYPELTLLGFACLIAILAAALWMLAKPDLLVHRQIRPGRVTEGEEAVGVITVTNEMSRRCPPITAAEWVAGRSVGVPLPSLAPRAGHSMTYALPTSRRGVYKVGPLTIGHTDPLRLMAVTKQYATESTLYVHPQTDLVHPVPTGQSRDQDGPTSSLAPQGGIAFHSLRDYVSGDDWRLIHWKSSARTGQLMVRHNVVPNEPRLMILLDTSESPYTEKSFEDAVSAAASLCVAAVRAGFPLELRTTGGGMTAADQTGEGLTPTLDLLAGVERDRQDPGLAALPSMVPEQGAVSLGVVTGQPEPAMLTALPQVRSRFMMISLVQFADTYAAPPSALHGVVSMNVRSREEFAATWNDLVRR